MAGERLDAQPAAQPVSSKVTAAPACDQAKPASDQAKPASDQAKPAADQPASASTSSSSAAVPAANQDAGLAPGKDSSTSAGPGASPSVSPGASPSVSPGASPGARSASGGAKSESSKTPADADKRAASDKRVDTKLKGKKPVRRGNAPCLSWLGEGPVKAVLVLVHGLGLHNGTYESFGKRMSDLGYAAYAIDVRGFGSWMEAKGRENVDFDGCLSDLEKTLKVVRRANPNKPVFLLGESMGGAIALRATALYPELVDGLISSVPAADRFKQNETGLKVAFHFLANPDKPFNVGEGVIKQATNKPELREAWSNDPLARMNLSPKELIQFQMFMNQNHDSAREIVSKPVLIVQGVQDKLVRPQGTVELFNELTTKDKEIVLIPNAEHLIFEENQFNDEVVDKVVDWITKHMTTPVQGAK